MDSQLELPLGSEYQIGNSNDPMCDRLQGIPWSYSRRSVLEQCPRRYYYEYYGSNLRAATSDPQKDKLRFLKELTNRHERAGQIVHLVIATSLRKMKSGETWTAKRMCDWSLSLFTKDVTYSRDYRRQNDKSNGEYPPKLLTEFYYDNPSANELCLESQARMTSAIEAFAVDPIYNSLREAGSKPDTFVEHHVSVNLSQPCKIEGRIDLAFRHANGTSIVDWKLGSPANGNESLQLVCYALWAQIFLGVQPGEIELYMAYLESHQLVSHRLEQDTISRGQARILQDIESMSFLDKYGRAGTVEAFSRCDQAAICSLCPFKEVCSPGEVPQNA